MIVRLLAVATALSLAACAGRPPTPVASSVPSVGKATPAEKPATPVAKGGGYYLDDGPGDNPPDNLDVIPDAVPRQEPLHRFANRPYSVLGRDYTPLREIGAYRERGIASWYGRKFHGQKTSSGEPYDMYGMTAAHPTLPIPSYARVSNPANGRSITVRINDRGPFHAGRIIDLSYTAAWKLGYIGNGSTLVDVVSLRPGQGDPAPVDDPIARLIQSEATPPRPLPEVVDRGGIYLQLGAFGNADNAERLRERLARELGDIGERLRVKAAGGMFRLHLGPWASDEEAHRAVARLAELLDFRPVVVRH
ncbi:MAG: septal ring lytic transglycosylase RlpA family protein [Rhodocyclaceae bacterium]|nr:septal ring lytic transglycosylase RlpA family protein [Rhodocyclaceae bacterium]MBK9310144.1 septal ring lytic transglycosylase RlpA family protein [Rhodocyclaceae bacterium]